MDLTSAIAMRHSEVSCLPLLLSCKTIHQEALAVVYGNCMLKAEDNDQGHYIIPFMHVYWTPGCGLPTASNLSFPRSIVLHAHNDILGLPQTIREKFQAYYNLLGISQILKETLDYFPYLKEVTFEKFGSWKASDYYVWLEQALPSLTGQFPMVRAFFGHLDEEGPGWLAEEESQDDFNPPNPIDYTRVVLQGTACARDGEKEVSRGRTGNFEMAREEIEQLWKLTRDFKRMKAFSRS